MTASVRSRAAVGRKSTRREGSRPGLPTGSHLRSSRDGHRFVPPGPGHIPSHVRLGPDLGPDLDLDLDLDLDRMVRMDRVRRLHAAPSGTPTMSRKAAVTTR